MQTFKQFLEEQVVRGTYNMPRQRLDFDKLYGKAFKITYPGNGTDKPGWAGVDNTPEEWSYSIVTPENRTAWSGWPEKKIGIAHAKQSDFLNGKQGEGPDTGKPNLDDEKYRQVVDAATKLGLLSKPNTNAKPGTAGAMQNPVSQTNASFAALRTQPQRQINPGSAR